MYRNIPCVKQLMIFGSILITTYLV